ncbi:MAG: hypothetical protein ACYTG0_35820, partial [Planctomycetota bacterium]
MQRSTKALRPAALAAIALACLVVAVFFPMLRHDFVQYDVSDQLLENPHAQSLTWGNLGYLFTSRCTTSYYPIRTLTFALDYGLWGPNASGFKLTNGLIHLANVLLVFWLVLRLLRGRLWATADPLDSRWTAPAAALAAGIFAVHPVVVEPVAWIAGREELLMTLGALGTIHLHVTARRLAERGRAARAAACHLGAALSCAAACLSNAVAAVIPALV